MQAIGRSRAQILEDRGLSTLTHMTSIENLRSILKIGLLPKNELAKQGIAYRDIADPDVQERRKVRRISLASGAQVVLHDLVPLYLNARNAMMYRRKELTSEMVLLDFSVGALLAAVPVAVLTDGNAGSKDTQVSEDWWSGNDKVLESIPWSWILRRETWWDTRDDGKRRAMAEILVAPSIANSLIHSIVVNSKTAEEAVQAMVGSELRTCDIICDQSRFF